jgi:hypothetical protein
MDQYLGPGQIILNDILMVPGKSAKEDNIALDPAQGSAGFPIQNLKILNKFLGHKYTPSSRGD